MERNQRRQVVIGIQRETYSKWERRAPFTPKQISHLILWMKMKRTRSILPGIIQTSLIKKEEQTDLKIIVQPSRARIFKDWEYEQAGAIILEDLSEADIILGVKLPGGDKSVKLLPNKTYMFFSHTIKGQLENMGLLQECLTKHIQLIDYECIVSEQQQQNGRRKRLVAFGRYAGIVGMMYTFHGLGLRLFYQTPPIYSPFLSFPPAWLHYNLDDAKRRVIQMGKQILRNGIDSTEPLIIALTGKGGAVHQGAMEILSLIPHEIVSIDDLPYLYRQQKTKLPITRNKIYIVQLATKDIYEKMNNTESFNRSDFQEHPEDYRCTFADRIAPYIHVLVNCIYWDQRFPRILTKQQIRTLYAHGHDRLLMVSDISCDVHGSIEFLERTTTIDMPFFQYDPISQQVISNRITATGITVMGVDILPTEFPCESSEHFGNVIFSLIQDMIIVEQNQNETQYGINTKLLPSSLAGACVTTVDGKLAPKFCHLDKSLNVAADKKKRELPVQQSIATTSVLWNNDRPNEYMHSLQDRALEIGYVRQCGRKLHKSYSVPMDVVGHSGDTNIKKYYICNHLA